jgi:hypothetical protein
MLDLCDLVYAEQLNFDMHIMHKLICYKLYIAISMFIMFVNLCKCLYVICDCV